jgi:anti-sigma B factor antagonist
MSIKVICPNGHELHVKSEFAGKSGLCPHCKSRIEVPKPAAKAVSEDDLMAVLGQPRKVHHEHVAHEPVPHDSEPEETVSRDAAHHSAQPAAHTHQPKKDASAAPPSPTISHRRRVCPKCCEIVSVSHAKCPICRTPLSEWTFPVPENKPSHDGGKSLCHYLGVRNQGGVMVVRFGEHRILDELTIKKFGDELIRVADRDDCHDLLLNFIGVIGLSSVMLGIMLMLRKKMSLKPGRIKLCNVGPEIMDVFHATKLGQLFEILGAEQDALKAFA